MVLSRPGTVFTLQYREVDEQSSPSAAAAQAMDRLLEYAPRHRCRCRVRRLGDVQEAHLGSTTSQARRQGVVEPYCLT